MRQVSSFLAAPRAASSGKAAIAGLLALALAGCGGGGNPLGNPPDVENPPPQSSGQKLAFSYFQKCINPIFLKPLPTQVNGVTTTNTCAASGCHSASVGAGGAFRLVPDAQPVDLANAANTADVIRASDMYKNFYSAQGEVVIGSTTDSRLLAKPRLLNVLHGGGLIFPNDQDPLLKLVEYWITHPVPQGQDEFSSAGNAMFTPPDAATGACNTQ